MPCVRALWTFKYYHVYLSPSSSIFFLVQASLLGSGVRLCDHETLAEVIERERSERQERSNRSISDSNDGSVELSLGRAMSGHGMASMDAVVDVDTVLGEGDILTFYGPLRVMTDIIYRYVFYHLKQFKYSLQYT